MRCSRQKQVILPCCAANGYLRTSKRGTNHFVHKHKVNCDWEPESWQHLQAKTEIVRACQELGYDTKTEVSGSDWRADVLATKAGASGLIKIAFEVQWSPQTLDITKERQAKYERDGIRCCWLFRLPPVTGQSKQLPVFQLAMSPDESLVVHVEKRTVSLPDFIEDLLSKRIRWCRNYRLKPVQDLIIMFFPIHCWKCKRQHHVYSVESKHISCCNKVLLESFAYEEEPPLRFRPEVIAAVKYFLKTDKAKGIRMGKIKQRYSRTLGEAYQSFGCPWCDAISGNHYFSIEDCSLQYKQAVKKVYLETRVYFTELAKEEDYKDSDRETGHWCYPRSGEFCTPKRHQG